MCPDKGEVDEAERLAREAFVLTSRAHVCRDGSEQQRAAAAAAEPAFRAALAAPGFDGLPVLLRAQVHDELGSVLDWQGKFDAAVEEHRRAVAVVPASEPLANSCEVPAIAALKSSNSTPTPPATPPATVFSTACTRCSRARA